MPSRKNFESNVKARRVTAERKNSKMIRAQILEEVEALKKVKV